MYPLRMLTRALPTLFGLLAMPLFQAVQAAAYTWSGATDTSWSVVTNWQGGIAPADNETGVELSFPDNPVNRTANNDRNGLSLDSVAVTTTNTGSDYTFTGNMVNLNGNMSFTNPGSGSLIAQWSIPLTLTTDVQISSAGRQSQMLGSIALNGHNLTWDMSGDVYVSGAISGNGNLVKNGSGSALVLYGNNGFNGTVTCNAGTLTVHHANALGSIGSGSTFNSCAFGISVGATTIAEPLTFTGGQMLVAYDTPTLSGSIALNGSVNLHAYGTTTISGDISGAGSLTKSQPGTLILSGNNSHSGTTTVNAGLLLVNGSSADSSFTVNGGGTLGGTGTTGAVTVNNGGTIAPGLSPEIINTGNLNLVAGSTYIAELDGPTVGTEYDQINVTGSVTLAGTLDVQLGYAPAPGTQFVIINNDGADAVVGSFAGLPEGATLVVGAETFQVTYQGGDGNDVVLSTFAAVATPGPAGWILLPLASLLLLAGGRAGRRRGAC